MHMRVDVYTLANVAGFTDVGMFSYMGLSPNSCTSSYMCLWRYLCCRVDIKRCVCHCLPLQWTDSILNPVGTGFAPVRLWGHRPAMDHPALSDRGKPCPYGFGG